MTAKGRLPRFSWLGAPLRVWHSPMGSASTNVAGNHDGNLGARVCRGEHRASTIKRSNTPMRSLSGRASYTRSLEPCVAIGERYRRRESSAPRDTRGLYYHLWARGAQLVPLAGNLESKLDPRLCGAIGLVSGCLEGRPAGTTRARLINGQARKRKGRKRRRYVLLQLHSLR